MLRVGVIINIMINFWIFCFYKWLSEINVLKFIYMILGVICVEFCVNLLEGGIILIIGKGKNVGFILIFIV